MERGPKVKTYLSGEDYRIPSGLFGYIVRVVENGVWVEHKLVSASVGLLFWACIYYPNTDIEVM